MSTKVCIKCKTLKTLPELSASSPNICKICWNKYQQKYRKNNLKRVRKVRNDWRNKNRNEQLKKEADWRKANPDKVRQNKLKHRYGITNLDYKKLHSCQKGKCAICKKKKKVLNVDHNHKNGKVRGLLCWSCNTGLGKFKDNIQFLKRAITYLKGDK